MSGALTAAQLAAFVHELRTPLASILTWEQILRTVDDAAVRGRALDAIRSAALEQLALVDRLNAAIKNG